VNDQEWISEVRISSGTEHDVQQLNRLITFAISIVSSRFPTLWIR